MTIASAFSDAVIFGRGRLPPPALRSLYGSQLFEVLHVPPKVRS